MESNSNHYLCTHGGLQFLLKCDYNAPCIKHYLPSIFYRDLAVFQEFKNKTKVCSFGDFLLWNNETITAEKNMLFSKSWFNKKFFFFIYDILNADWICWRNFKTSLVLKKIVSITFNSWLLSLLI